MSRQEPAPPPPNPTPNLQPPPPLPVATPLAQNAQPSYQSRTMLALLSHPMTSDLPSELTRDWRRVRMIPSPFVGTLVRELLLARRTAAYPIACTSYQQVRGCALLVFVSTYVMS